MAFHVGQLVVCLTDFPISRARGFNTPDKGCVYTVRELNVGRLNGQELPSLLLQEITNRVNLLGEEYRFRQDNFRPVTTRNQEIIASLLQPLPQKVDA